MRILIVSDAWFPQVNGVVRTLSVVADKLRAMGDTVEVIGPDRFHSMPMPGYAEIRLAIAPKRKLARLVAEFRPEIIHIATEGPLGWAMRGLCRRNHWPFTTAFHTRFPEYLEARTGIPADWSWRVMRRFHEAGEGTFAATASLRQELTRRGFTKLRTWTRGVDLDKFRPGEGDAWAGLARPIFLYAGRVAIEKNIEAFLSLDLPGTKVVVGGGPALESLKQKFPQVTFTGYRENGALARSYAGADVFVFPSRTDTFGLVLLEALASGTPVAAFPVTGPIDVVTDSRIGALDEDLRAACLKAIECDRAACRQHAEAWSWDACVAQFRAVLVPIK
ncbi:MAG: glycosyltransferase family 1 protein [Roseomonas sp.]|nr:glycosyltransferase family 1 protein [Roseomonas sp.]